MIYNERQYKITKSAMAEMDKTLRVFGMDQALVQTSGDVILAKALVDSIASERDILRDQVQEYEMLKLGLISSFKASSLSELPELLIKARIAKGLSQKGLAEKLGLKEQQIQRYEAENYASASLRRLIEVSDCLGLQISEQVRLEANVTEKTSNTLSTTELINFPVKEMYKRGWFKGFTGSLKQAEFEAENLVRAFLSPIGMQPTLALRRQHVRSGSAYDRYALLAWQFRILGEAKKLNIKSIFKKSALDQSWIQGLVRLSAREDGPALASSYLKEAGIALIVEPHLRRTYLDGAAFWLNESGPVIGMTLRYDRLDNFWFVLCHELAHIFLHLDGGEVDVCFDDLDASPDALEEQADTFALNTLIPSDEWETSVARYVHDPSSVRDFAAKLQIHPSIVAGRIRREADNYLILGDLIGASQVRKLFPQITFGI